MAKFQRLRGFKDIYGAEAQQFGLVEAAAREVFSAFGFEEIRAPILEEKALFSRALGTETDVVQKEMYAFADRSKIEVALRPEGTAGVVRAYLENDLDKTKGLAKLFYLGPMFRSERPQAGRLRQFHQIGVEQLGTASPLADAETIQCLAVFLGRVGAGGYRIKLNNLGTFEEREVFKKKLREYFLPKKDRLCQDCRARLEKNVFRVLDCKRESCREVIKKSTPISEFLGKDSRAHYETAKRALADSGISFGEDPFMVRGLDYYTMTVFEVTHPALGAQDAVAAGGRYDRLIESFGGPKLGAVGFAAGVERLLLCMKKEAEALAGASFFIVTMGEEALRRGFRLLSDLRREGVRVSMDFSAKSMKSQMRAADKERVSHVIILGEDELAKNVCLLKNMKNGHQEEFKLDSIAGRLRAMENGHA